jgi:hypothetical protein
MLFRVEGEDEERNPSGGVFLGESVCVGERQCGEESECIEDDASYALHIVCQYHVLVAILNEL